MTRAQILGAAVALTTCATSPTGRKQLMLVPEEQIDAMSTEAFAQLERQQEVSKDPAVNEYVRCVANAITSKVKSDEQWRVVVFEEPSANAFALPGGQIGVHTGLLKVAKTPSQLATVLGHEVGHVLARHGGERVSQNVAVQGGLAAVNAVMADSQKKPLVMAALGVGAQVGVLLPYSRTHESEADEVGLDLMAKAGFDPDESVQLWRNMARASEGQPPEFLSTHPSHQTRIEELTAQIPKARRLRAKAGDRPHCTPP